MDEFSWMENLEDPVKLSDALHMAIGLVVREFTMVIFFFYILRRIYFNILKQRIGIVS